MKHCFRFFRTAVVMAVVLFFASSAVAQSLQSFSYQSSVPNVAGKAAAAQNVAVRVSIAQGSAEGQVVYSETHTVSTDANGVFSIAVGQGKTVSGVFSGINWGGDTYFLRCEIDPAGGDKYVIATTQQIVGVAVTANANEGEIMELKSIVDSLEQALEDACNNCQKSGNDATRTVKIDNGALPGVFTVAKSQKVRFSMGNLQYQAKTDKWRFAKTQYDVVGENNGKVSETYKGWIDLFAWGTSGYQDKSDPQSTHYQPYSTSTEENVEHRYNHFGYGPSTNMKSPDLTGKSSKYDWGVNNAIINGGKKEGQWRTLTSEEWDYILNMRSTTFENGGSTLDIRYCMANVAGRSGIILFPDTYTLPEGMPVPKTYNMGGKFSDYALSDVQWNILEDAGAVFLPVTGYRVGTNVNDAGNSGYYWSATNNGNDYALRLSFESEIIGAAVPGFRFDGFAVRLVQGVK